MIPIYNIHNFFEKEWNDFFNHIKIYLKFNLIFHLYYDFFFSYSNRSRDFSNGEYAL